MIFRGSWIEIGLSISLRTDLSQTTSLVAFVCSQVESATVGWRLELQLIASLPTLKIKPEVDRRIY